MSKFVVNFKGQVLPVEWFEIQARKRARAFGFQFERATIEDIQSEAVVIALARNAGWESRNLKPLDENPKVRMKQVHFLACDAARKLFSEGFSDAPRSAKRVHPMGWSGKFRTVDETTGEVVEGVYCIDDSGNCVYDPPLKRGA
jgi:hypothetical protein